MATFTNKPTAMSSTEVHNDLFFLNEHPKIDAALKSFHSWFSARQQIAASVANDPRLSNQTKLLSYTRTLSKAINAHIFPITQDRNTVVIAQVWNEIQTRQQKPTKWLGRTALREAWPDLEVAIDGTEEELEYFEFFKQEFKRLLFIDDLSDAKLVWDKDNGKEEFARRAKDRADRAA